MAELDTVNARAAQVIADGFVNGIPYESQSEGKAVLRLYQFNTAALPPQLKNEVVASVRAIGEGLIQMLDKQGIILIDAVSLQALRSQVQALESEVQMERAAAESCYDEIRYVLRNCDDTPQGHADFYAQVSELIFPENTTEDLKEED